METPHPQNEKSIVDKLDPMEQYKRICSFCLRSAIEVDLDDLESGYVYSETLGAQRSIKEIENGVTQGQVDDILELGMRCEVEPAKDYRLLTRIQT
jgi:hypothetical protein